MHDQVIYEREWSTRFLHDVYKWFFTESEVDSMLQNKDIWMHGPEVLERAKVMMEMLQLEAEEQHED